MKLASTLFLSLSLLAPIGACQQGEGDVCQDTVDCEDGLECVAATETCEKPGSSGPTFDAAPGIVIDAAPPIDATAAEVDATVADADLPDSGPV